MAMASIDVSVVSPSAKLRKRQESTPIELLSLKTTSIWRLVIAVGFFLLPSLWSPLVVCIAHVNRFFYTLLVLWPIFSAFPRARCCGSCVRNFLFSGSAPLVVRFMTRNVLSPTTRIILALLDFILSIAVTMERGLKAM